MIVVIMAICLNLSACNNVADNLEISKYNDYAALENIDCVLSDISQSDNKCEVAFEIHNNSDEQIVWGTKWYLEQYQNNEWYTIDFKENSAWEDYALTLDSAQQTTVTVSLQDYFDLPLHDGTYRLVQVLKEDRILCIEFEISN